MLRFKTFLNEGVDKIEFRGHEFVPDRTVRVLKNPTVNQIEGLLNLSDKKGVGAGSGEVRWFVNGNNLHTWQDPDTVHYDVHEALFGTSTREYHSLEVNNKNFASGSFLRPDVNKPWHIGIRQDRGRDFIKEHPAFKNLLHHDEGPRKIEKFST